MVSSKERLRLAAQFDKAVAHMDRQKAAIDRLLALNTECMAALYEIANGDEMLGLQDARDRAQAAIDRVSEPAAALRADREQSGDEEEPTSSEENKDG